MDKISKTVLVTGSSRGIGRAIALKFAQNGYNVVINCSKSASLLNDVENDIKKCGVRCLSFVGDIGDSDNAVSLFKLIKNEFGGLDVLVNNAGISYIGLLTDMSFEEWNNLIQTNLTSVFNCSRLALPYMISKKCGKIINISSVWGVVGASCEVAYSASKGGINSFTKALAKELAPSNIQVNAVACGAIDTEMNHFLDEEEKQMLLDEIPFGRMGNASEVADFVFDLVSGKPYLTGQVINFDGAWI